jgi:hypothetical protein
VIKILPSIRRLLINSFTRQVTNRRCKFKLAAGIVFFNDCSSLKRCLDSLVNDVDVIFAIDGKFPNFPSDCELSTDGSRELLKSYSRCVLIDFPGYEFEKRSKYLEYCSKYSVDVLLIIDSDEFVLDNANWKIFRRNLEKIIIDRDKSGRNVYAIRLQSPGESQTLPYPRIWHRPYEMEYYGGRHYYFRNKNPIIKNVPHQGDHSLNIIEGIELGHDHQLRSQYHMQSRFRYQTWLENYERSLPQ